MTPIYLASGKVKTLQSASTIASIQGTSPYVVTTTAAHNLETGDIVQLSCFPDLIFTVTVQSTTTFQLNETQNGGLIWQPQSGTVNHLGFATAPQSTASIPAGTSFSYQWTINSLTGTGYVRAEFEDATQSGFADARPGPAFCSPQGPSNNSDTFTVPSYQWGGMRISGTGDQVRCKVLLSGGPGAQCNFSAALE